MTYLDLLERLHEALQPQVYLEIGVEFGTTLTLSRTRSIAVDPDSRIRPAALQGKPWLKLYRQHSDEFFQTHDSQATLEGLPLDLAFIDGFHEFTQVVRDLEHVEQWGHTGSVVVIHDVIPFNARHASRQFHKGSWTGDVWRIVPFLREYRPDLTSRLIDVTDTGLLVVTGLNLHAQGMADRAQALNQDYPPDGAEYERLVDVYLATHSPETPEAFLRDFPGLVRPVRHRLESDGWHTEAGTSELVPVASAGEPSLRVALTDPPRLGYRVRLALIARGMDALRLGFRGEGNGDASRERNVTIDIARPGALSHELEHVALFTDPSHSLFDLEMEAALGSGERMREIIVQPVDVDLNDVPAAPGMAIELQRIEIEQIPVVSRVVRLLPEHLPGKSVPGKSRDGKRDAVIFAWFVPRRMPELGEYYTALLRYYLPDARIFVGMNHGSDPVWEDRLRAADLDVDIAWARPEIGDYWDATGFLTALEAFSASAERFDLVWFGHTKGGSGAQHTDYQRNRLELQRNFWSRRAEIEQIFTDRKIGVFARRFTPWWDGIAGEELPALQRVYRDERAPLGLGAFDTYFVMREEIVRRFCCTVADGFFRTPPGTYGANRWFFEMAFPSVATMQGFEPYIDPDVRGENHPRDDAWLRHDPKQNHRLVQRELDRWRRDPVAYVPERIRQIWTH